MAGDFNPYATPALVLGLLGLILALVIGLAAPYVPLALSVIGLILSSRAAACGKSTMVTAGFVLSLVGVVLSAVYLVMWLTCLGVTSTVTDSIIGVMETGR